MRNYLKYKALETHFDGYVFRSRLEARWATFFKALGIPYEYEKEGYILNGISYLPDFWLPQQGCWIEIKGQEPTEEEMRKASGLALCTQNIVFVISGNIASPDALHLQDIRSEFPPSISKFEIRDNKPHYEAIPVSVEVLAILQMLESAYMTPREYEGSLVIESQIACQGGRDASRFSEKLQIQAKNFPQIVPYLEKYESDLIKALTVESGWHIDIQDGISITELEWTECTSCHEISIGIGGYPHFHCPNGEENEAVSDSPRLIEAFTAARQARFEHKKGRSEVRS